MVILQRIFHLSQSHVTNSFDSVHCAQKCSLVQFDLLTQTYPKMMHCILFMSLDLLFCFDPLEEASCSSLPLPLPSVGRFNSHNSPVFNT